MSKIVNPNLRTALLAEGEELFKKRARLEARLAALDKLHDCMIEAAALHEINESKGRSMKLKIFLDRESYRCLTSCIPIEARTRSAILTAVLLGNTRVVDCDDEEARELLLKTRSECPGAAHRIIEAMNLAGLTP